MTQTNYIVTATVRYPAHDERDGIRRRVLAGMSSADASKAIEWLTETIAKREKEAEA
jgi:hypothetical protein